MSINEISNKKLRALLNSIREACVYRSPIALSANSTRYQATAIEMKEIGFRDLDEERSLIISFDKPLPDNLRLQIKDKEEFFSINLNKTKSENGKQTFSFLINSATQENRRRASREKAPESYYVPSLLYLKGNEYYPVQIHTRLINTNENAICFEARIPISLSKDDILEGKIFSQSDTFANRANEAKIDLIREHRIDEHFGGHLTYATIVSMIPENQSEEKNNESCIQSTNVIKLQFKLYLKNGELSTFRIQKILQNGFFAENDDYQRLSTPSYFLAESTESGIRFTVSKSNNSYHFKLLGSTAGGRAQWYNFIAEKALGVQCKFTPDDVQEVSRLMLESGIYIPQAMSNIVLSHGYFNSKWPIENTLSKTKFRWFVRDSTGSAIGHTAGLRVSDKLWAAIDNIGSQSYEGSWNKEFVTKWIRSFSELLSNSNENPLVQWTYNPNSHIWNEFHRVLKTEYSSLIDSETTFSFSVFDNRPIALNRKNHKISIKDLPLESLPDLGHNLNSFFSSLFRKNKTPSFSRDFEHDYGFEHQRFLKVITGPSFSLICTYSNYPGWASINRGHDWTYLIPLEMSENLSLNEENSVLDLVKEQMLKDGCYPFQAALISEKFKLDKGNIRININVKPEALIFAALSIEGEK